MKVDKRKSFRLNHCLKAADNLRYLFSLYNRKKKQKPEQLGGLANCGSVLKLELEPVMASGAEITQKKYEKELFEYASQILKMRTEKLTCFQSCLVFILTTMNLGKITKHKQKSGNYNKLESSYKIQGNLWVRHIPLKFGDAEIFLKLRERNKKNT
ncbi:hypothetical protein YC2023_014924 [Brassica napus]